MSQRVRITYSIEVDELDNEVVRLAREADQIMGELHQTSIIEGDVLSIATSSNIGTLRATLYDLDNRLADIDTIITSYLQYKVGAPPGEQEAAPQYDPQLKIDQLRGVLDTLNVPLETSDEKPA